MLQGQKSDQEYALNEDVTVRIKSKRDGDLIKHELTLKHTYTTVTPIIINNKAQLISMIQDIDLEDRQTSLV